MCSLVCVPCMCVLVGIFYFVHLSSYGRARTLKLTREDCPRLSPSHSTGQSFVFGAFPSPPKKIAGPQWASPAAGGKSVSLSSWWTREGLLTGPLDRWALKRAVFQLQTLRCNDSPQINRILRCTLCEPRPFVRATATVGPLKPKPLSMNLFPVQTSCLWGDFKSYWY